jgi:hypothetical protein
MATRERIRGGVSRERGIDTVGTSIAQIGSFVRWGENRAPHPTDLSFCFHIIIAGRANVTKRISRIEPWSAGRLFAVIYFFSSLLFVIPMALMWSFVPFPAASKPPFGPGVLLALPFLYAAGGLLLVALMCAIYNLAARFVGGLEISVIEVPDVE